MSPQELELMQMKIKTEVLLTLIRGLYTGLANSSPAAMEASKQTFAALRKEHSLVAIKGLSAEYSDLVSAEAQEALDDVLKYIENGFHS